MSLLPGMGWGIDFKHLLDDYFVPETPLGEAMEPPGTSMCTIATSHDHSPEVMVDKETSINCPNMAQHEAPNNWANQAKIC